MRSHLALAMVLGHVRVFAAFLTPPISILRISSTLRQLSSKFGQGLEQAQVRGHSEFCGKIVYLRKRIINSKTNLLLRQSPRRYYLDNEHPHLLISDQVEMAERNDQWEWFYGEGETAMNQKAQSLIPDRSRIPEMIAKRESDLLTDWMREQLAATTLRSDLMRESELREQSRQFLNLVIRAASQQPGLNDINAPAWEEAREFLSGVSRSRAHQGFSPSETATFIFSLKQPLFSLMRQELEGDPRKLADEMWVATALLDKLGLYTTEAYQKAREEVIRRQQQELLELSTPVVVLWEGILALPLIGTLDSARTQVVMESLLEKIVETGASIAIIDITGVPTVDTLVAQHLLKTVSAARLMGADCIISGIRPQIAQTIVHLGVNLTDVITKSSLADAFAVALRRAKMAITRAENHS